MVKLLIYIFFFLLSSRKIITIIPNPKESTSVDVKLITGSGLFHIYPLFPMPEAYSAFKEIKKEIIG